MICASVYGVSSLDKSTIVSKPIVPESLHVKRAPPEHLWTEKSRATVLRVTD